MPPEPDTRQIRETIASEIHRRATRFHSGPAMTPVVREHVRGELIGLRTALAISLGHPATDGVRDAEDFYQQWLKGQPRIPFWHDSEDRDRGKDPDYYLTPDELDQQDNENQGND